LTIALSYPAGNANPLGAQKIAYWALECTTGPPWLVIFAPMSSSADGPWPFKGW
jgi:hypothetical protein